MKKVIVVAIAVIVVVGAGYAVYALIKGKKGSSGVVENFTSQGFEVGAAGSTKKVAYIADPLKEDFGVSIYPGAKPFDDGSAKSAEATADGNSAKIGIFTTADSVERVVAYYQKQIGSNSQTNTAVLADTTYTVIAKKDVLDPVIEVYKANNTTTFSIQKKK